METERVFIKIEKIHNSVVFSLYHQMVKQIDEYGFSFWEDYKLFLENQTDSYALYRFQEAVIYYFRIKAGKY